MNNGIAISKISLLSFERKFMKVVIWSWSAIGAST